MKIYPALCAICLSISLCHAGKVRLSIDLNQFDPNKNIMAQVEKKFSTEELALNTSLFFKQPSSKAKQKHHTRANKIRLRFRLQAEKESILGDFLGVFLKVLILRESSLFPIKAALNATPFSEQIFSV